jgi:hypothetical protein
VSSIDANTAYKRGWDRSNYYDDSAEDFDKSRARFAAKHGEDLAAAWEQGWSDAAGHSVD